MKTLICAVVLCLAVAGTSKAASCAYLEAEQRPTTGGGAPLPAAGQTDWYRNGEAIELFGDRYEKYGLPRELGEFEFGGLTEAGKWKGVPAFTEAEGEGEVIYVPVDPKVCSFQPYELKN